MPYSLYMYMYVYTAHGYIIMSHG